MRKLQQGDVILRRIESIPSGEQKEISTGRCVVAHGESGHSHVVTDDDATLIQIGETMLLKIGKQTKIVHEEHKAIMLNPGLYEIGRVQEYDYFSKMARPVQD